MVRKCSHCGNVGHNSRTCRIQKNYYKHREKFKLFGVQLDNIHNGALPTSLLKKSISLDCLPSSSSSSASSSSSEKLSSGYLSDGLVAKSHERKKGVPWSEEEHRVFLVGLEKLGKGDWRGISRKFVTTRTPTQVASHAQKYFLRLGSLKKSKQRRPSLFDAGAIAIAKDNKFTVQVVEGRSSSSSNYKPITNLHYSSSPSSSISFGIINNSSEPIWFDQHQPFNKFLESPIIIIKSSIDQQNKTILTHHHHQPADDDLQLSLSTPNPILQQQLEDQPCNIAIHGPISVT